MAQPAADLMPESGPGPADLAGRLRRLAGAARRVAGADPGLAGVLHEIDTIVLPRQVTLFDGDRAVARLVVSNRRLQSVEPADGPAGDGEIAAPTDPGAAARLFSARLCEIAARAPELSARVTGRVALFGQTAMGCTAAALAAEAGIGQGGDAGAGPVVDSFLEALRDKAVAWLRTGPDGTRTGGDPALVRALAQAQGRGLGRRPQGRLGPNRPECQFVPLSDSLALVCAESARAGLVALVPTAALAGAMDAWTRAAG